MRSRPADIDDGQLIDAVREHWDLAVASVEYVAIGGGSHHWQARSPETAGLWLTVDDLDNKPFLGASRTATLRALRQALDVANELRNSGLEFVLAPQPTTAGNVLVTLTERYALAAYPLVENGRTYPWGMPLPPAEREAVVEMLVRLHQATPQVTARGRSVPVELAERATLEAAFRAPWSNGPYAERARAMLVANAGQVQRMLDTFDGWAAEVADRQRTEVISHGEPHPANLMRFEDGLLLLDWDTVGLARPERDLWWLAKDGLDGLQRYTEATGHCLDTVALKLYRLRWQLDDLIWCVRGLVVTHSETRDTQLAWNALPNVVQVPEWMRGSG